MLKKASKTSQAVARLAALRASKTATLAADVKDKAASAKCIRPFALSAVAPPKFRLPRAAIVRFIAAIASKRAAASVNKA